MSNIVWQDENGFFKIKKSQDGFYYGERKGVNSLAFILCNRKKDIYGVVQEPMAQFDEQHTHAFGGSLDELNKNPKEIVIQEVKEETGYIVDNNNVKYLGKCLSSTQMNEYVYLFVVDVTNAKFYGKQPQATSEQLNKVHWMKLTELVGDLDDWKAGIIACRYILKSIDKAK